MGSLLGSFFLGINQTLISLMWVVPSVCAVVYRYQLIVLKPDGTSFRVFYLHIQGYAPIHREDLQCIRHGTSHNHSQTALKYFHLIFYSLRNYGFLRQAYTHNFIKQIFRLFGIGLIQSALQPLWVLACSTIVEYSQQERFYRVALPTARQTPNLEDQWLERSNSRHQVSPASQKRREQPQQRKVELWARNCREFWRKLRLPCHFWVILHAVNLRHGTDGFTSPPKEGALRIFALEKSDGFGRVWTYELGY